MLWVLYDRVLRVDAAPTGRPDRDRFLLSKGHGPMAYYAMLAAKGFFDAGRPAHVRPTFDSPLGHHPDRSLIAGVEISSGSLGHGLPLAVGWPSRCGPRAEPGRASSCLVGDAELDEGIEPRGDRARRAGSGSSG